MLLDWINPSLTINGEVSGQNQIPTVSGSDWFVIKTQKLHNVYVHMTRLMIWSITNALQEEMWDKYNFYHGRVANHIDPPLCPGTLACT